MGVFGQTENLRNINYEPLSIFIMQKANSVGVLRPCFDGGLPATEQPLELESRPFPEAAPKSFVDIRLQAPPPAQAWKAAAND